MIIVDYKNGDIENFDGTDFIIESGFIIFLDDECYVGCVNCVDVKSVVVQEGEKNIESVKDVEKRMINNFRNNIKNVDTLINFSLDSVNDFAKKTPNLISKDYKLGYNEAMSFLKRELIGVHLT